MEELLEAYVRYLVAEKNLSPFTLRNYRSDLSHFARYLEDEEGVPVLEADRMMARRYLGMLKESGMATASLTRKVSTIRSFYRFLVREGKIESTPLTGIVAPKREQRLPTILSKDDLDALIESADETTPSGLRNRAMLEMMYASGVRLSEIVGLNLRSVDLDERTAVVRGKGNKERLDDGSIGRMPPRAGLGKGFPDGTGERVPGADCDVLGRYRKGQREQPRRKGCGVQGALRSCQGCGRTPKGWEHFWIRSESWNRLNSSSSL